MKLVTEFTLEGTPRLYNSSNRLHWAVKNKEAWKWKRLVQFKCIELGVSGLNLIKAKITIIRHSCKEPDFDGLVSGGKHLLDGLKLAKVITDDKQSVIGQPVYLWQFRGRSQGGMVTMRVEKEESGAV